MLRWPDRETVLAAARAWASRQRERDGSVLRIGVFGSYARGDWGVGSDLDLVAVVAASWEPFACRPLAFDLLPLPVPADLLVYTAGEWERLGREGGRFAGMLARETIWLEGP